MKINATINSAGGIANPVLPYEDTAFYTNLGTGFNTGGSIISSVQQSDNKLVIGGGFTSLNGNTRTNLVRLNLDGTEDTAFYTNLGTSFNSTVWSVGLQSTGKILVSGVFSSFNGNARKYVVRLNADGTEDNTFNTNGSLSSLQNNDGRISIQSDDKVILSGEFSNITSKLLIRLNADGTRDTAFNTNLGSGFDNTIFGTAIQADGKILVFGGFNNFNGSVRNFLIRLNTNGTEDTTFYTNLGTGFNSSIRFASVQSDGKILVAGDFTTFNGNLRSYLLRLNADGTEDTTFGTNVGNKIMGSGFGIVLSAKQQASGKIIVCGPLTGFNGNTRNQILRLNADGTEDAAFYTKLGTAFNAQSRFSLTQADSQVLIGGDFTTFNTNSRNKLVRLTSYV